MWGDDIMNNGFENDYVKISAVGLKKMVTEILIVNDVPADHADIVSDVLVTADLRGVESHGVSRLFPYYLKRLNEGSMTVNPDIKLVQNFGATFLLDADNGLGHVACHKAMTKSIELANTYGVGIGGVKNSNHFGIAGYYSMMALKEDMIGICISNSQPLVLPTYSKKRLLGTNPISIAIPAGNAKPFVLDMATSVVPLGKIQVHHRKELDVPTEWGADSQGKATSSPAEIMEGGGLFPLGGPAETSGYKGYGLAAAVDIFSGVLTGSSFLAGVLNAAVHADPCGVGHFLMAVRVQAFMDPSEFESRMDQFIEQLKTAPLAEGSERIFIAGEKEFTSWEENLESGAPVHRKVWAELLSLCSQYKINPPAVL